MAVLIKEEVDIFTMPKVDDFHKSEGAEFTIGDLHSNSMKLIFMLIKHGIANGIEDEDYRNLVDVYKTPTDDLSENAFKVI